MYKLLLLIFDICLFKKGPQDLSGSLGLLYLLILFQAGVNFMILMMSMGVFDAVIQVFVGILLILGLSWLVLFFLQQSSRYLQTASALMATDALIGFFAVPAMAALMGQGAGLGVITITLLMIWSWLVYAHIFRHALDQSFVFGLGVAFLYILVSYQVMGFLFPEIDVIEQ